MGLFYKVSDKKLLNDRNTIFKEIGMPALENNGFERATFKTSWNGEYNKSIRGYIYEISRIRKNKFLETIDVYILYGERWLQIYLNVFELKPEIEVVSMLKNNSGLSFGIPPNSLTKMRLRSDEYKGPPLFYMLFLPEHKVGNYYTKSGYEFEINKLKKLIKKDMENINSFIEKWHELHKPNITDWEGNIISQGTTTKSNIQNVKPADALHGIKGGLPEFKIKPNDVKIIDMKVLKP